MFSNNGQFLYLVELAEREFHAMSFGPSINMRILDIVYGTYM